jgi:hypothetical protein
MNQSTVSGFHMPEENEKQVKLKESLRKLRESEIITYRLAPVMAVIIVVWCCFILSPYTYAVIPVYETNECIAFYKNYTNNINIE